MTSTEGNNWNARNSGTNSNLKGIAFGNDTIVAVGENGLILQSDPFDTANVPKDSNVDSDDGGDESCFISTMK